MKAPAWTLYFAALGVVVHSIPQILPPRDIPSIMSDPSHLEEKLGLNLSALQYLSGPSDLARTPGFSGM